MATVLSSVFVDDSCSLLLLELKIKVISGNAEERKDLINDIEKYDLIVTSYDLLKRDIEVYEEKDYTFRFIIADEAQYLKNNNTKKCKSNKTNKSKYTHRNIYR